MRLFAVLAALLCATPAAALDMPERKAGLWELKLRVANSDMPGQTMRQCVDAATDKLMNKSFGAGAPQQSCSKQAVSRQDGALVVESECRFMGVATSSRAVITGSFDSAYSMQVTTRTGADENRMTVDATWLGACAAGQRPGDMVMPNGMTMNVLELGAMRPPKLPQR